MNFWLFTFLIATCGVACSPTPDVASEVERPADISSNQDRKDIEVVKTEIQDLAEQIGVPGDFKNFPVIVVSKYPGQDGPLAYCHESQNHSSRYIGIVKTTMETYLSEQHAHRDSSFLFKLLVHEYGHCLFDRGHDETMLGRPGYNIFIVVPDQNGETLKPIGAEVAVSAMASINWWMTDLPRELKKYYLREIAGETRWRKAEDLEIQPGLRLLRADQY